MENIRTLLTGKKRSHGDCVEVSMERVKRPKPSGKENKIQLHLNLGQKTFGHVKCAQCGMLFTYGQYDDELLHYNYHKKFMRGMEFRGWKHERVVNSLPDGSRIVLILPTDSKHHLKKVKDICTVMDEELGACDPEQVLNRAKTFVYVSGDKRVVGCVLAEEITKGYPVMSLCITDNGSFCCSDEYEPAILGINRVWVHASHRRKGIATTLVDTARKHFVFGYIVPKNQIAFTDPSPDGRAFAETFTGTSKFLVYR